MTLARIDLSRCDNAPGCMVSRACPQGALARTVHGWVVEESRCSGCGTCVRACPHAAVSMVDGEKEPA